LANSREIRWFNLKENKTILEWFAGQGIHFSNIKPRTDFYLKIPDCQEINIKLREGKIEIKQRKGHPVLHKLGHNASGYLEDWVKWSFSMSETDTLIKDIQKGIMYDWIKLYKQRLGVKITTSSGNNWQTHDINEVLPIGCQIEYTKLEVEGKIWYTFAIEWFGDFIIQLDNDHISEMLGDTIFTANESFGYNAFINKII
jgi:hypothetical protein